MLAIMIIMIIVSWYTDRLDDAAGHSASRSRHSQREGARVCKAGFPQVEGNQGAQREVITSDINLIDYNFDDDDDVDDDDDNDDDDEFGEEADEVGDDDETANAAEI